MKTNPNHPDEIWLGRKDYCARTDWKVNGWLFAAAILSGLSDILFPHVVKEWPLAVRAVVAVMPFLALLLWARSLTHWIRGMDELHRRITLSATLFSVSAAFFFVVLWHRLERAEVFQALFPARLSSAGTWDIGTVGHIFLLMTFCYFLGHRIFTRRYQ